MALALEHAHTVPVPSTPENKSFLLDVVMDSTWTGVVKEGAAASYCWIYGVTSCQSAQQALLAELSDSDTD